MRERASPRLLARALEAPGSIAALGEQKAGDRSLPAVSIKGTAGTFIVLFDPTTHLPAIVRTRDVDNVYGDSNYDLVLSDWKDIAGTKRAHTLSFQLNGMEVQRLTLKQVTVDAPIPAMQEFAAKFKKRFNYVCDHNGIKGYTAVYFIKFVTEKMGKFDSKGFANTMKYSGSAARKISKF